MSLRSAVDLKFRTSCVIEPVEEEHYRKHARGTNPKGKPAFFTIAQPNIAKMGVGRFKRGGGCFKMGEG